MHKNFKNIDKIVYGNGAFNQLDGIIEPVRKENNNFFVFVVDKYFEGRDLANRIPNHEEDVLIFIDVDIKEPYTEQIDNLRDSILASKGLPSGIVGIGGGSIMDIAKASALMFTNEGSSTLYQGLDLIKKPGIYHLGVPTISGTGAECSMTAVLSGPEKKLGLKCEWTVFNQVILDPDLTATVPTDQWFYTGMDCYIHCIESASGLYYNPYSKAYGDQAVSLCREVFVEEGHGRSKENDEKLMIASLFGGLSLTYSEVGACHAFSYGLSMVKGMRHGYANCVAFNHLKKFYGDAVDEFREMLRINNVTLPQNLAADWSEEEIMEMSQIAYNLTHMWNHAIGEDWKEKWTVEDIANYYRKM
jgi:3-deoxy-alpha-D-manno-octulosonate 8-oxidase